MQDGYKSWSLYQFLSYRYWLQKNSRFIAFGDFSASPHDVFMKESQIGWTQNQTNQIDWFFEQNLLISSLCKIIGTLLGDIGFRLFMTAAYFFLLLEVSRKRLSWSPISQEVITEKSFASNWWIVVYRLTHPLNTTKSVQACLLQTQKSPESHIEQRPINTFARSRFFPPS